MENDRAKQVIVTILQKSLTGQLDPSSNFNPQFVASAIADKVNFEKSYDNVKAERLIKTVIALKKNMQDELVKLTPEDTLLKNFLRGKITAYDELLSVLK